MKRTHVAVLAVVMLVAFAGCLEMTFTYEVNAEGDLDRVAVEMDMTEEVYEWLEENAEEEGYDSFEEAMESDLRDDLDEDEVGEISVTGEESEMGHLVTIEVTDVPIEEMDDVDTEVDEEADTVRFTIEDVDDEFQEPDDDAEEQILIQYVVKMPGEIHDTNAHELSDGDTVATWNLTEQSESELYAESDASESAIPVPGFGVAAAVLAGLLATLAIARRATA